MKKNIFLVLIKRSTIYLINSIFKKTEKVEKLLSIINLNLTFNNLKNSKTFLNDEDLHKDVFSKFKNSKINLLEFGTHEAFYIKKFITYNSHKNSTFKGFDSFYGLPESWTSGFPKGTFNLDGVVPKVEDKRVDFIKGYFQNTLPKFISENKFEDELIVHYDADLFSSTLFCLLQVDRLKKNYTAIFDEFFPDEANALKKYIDISGASVEIIGKTQNINAKVPRVVSCIIKPTNIFNC